MKYISPSIDKTAFNCPHCEVLTTQTWFPIFSSNNEGGYKKPVILNESEVESDEAFFESDLFRKINNSFGGRFWKNFDESNFDSDFIKKNITEKVIFQQYLSNSFYCPRIVWNMHISCCLDCEKISIWIRDRLLYPLHGQAPRANPDLPNDVREDYNEANSILNHSPRGAAALLRLAVQKLCKHLGEPGESLNIDIKALVKKGLAPEMQKALDAVRVIGNNAVHPGQIDLRDDKATAESLFHLLNIIAERMISDLKRIDEVYEKLPKEKREEIAKRDGKPSTKPNVQNAGNKGQEELGKKK